MVAVATRRERQVHTQHPLQALRVCVPCMCMLMRSDPHARGMHSMRTAAGARSHVFDGRRRPVRPWRSGARAPHVTTARRFAATRACAHARAAGRSVRRTRPCRRDSESGMPAPLVTGVRTPAPAPSVASPRRKPGADAGRRRNRSIASYEGAPATSDARAPPRRTTPAIDPCLECVPLGSRGRARVFRPAPGTERKPVSPPSFPLVLHAAHGRMTMDD